MPCEEDRDNSSEIDLLFGCVKICVEFIKIGQAEVAMCLITYVAHSIIPITQ